MRSGEFRPENEFALRIVEETTAIRMLSRPDSWVLYVEGPGDWNTLRRHKHETCVIYYRLSDGSGLGHLGVESALAHIAGLNAAQFPFVACGLVDADFTGLGGVSGSGRLEHGALARTVWHDLDSEVLQEGLVDRLVGTRLSSENRRAVEGQLGSTVLTWARQTAADAGAIKYIVEGSSSVKFSADYDRGIARVQVPDHLDGFRLDGSSYLRAAAQGRVDQGLIAQWLYRSKAVRRDPASDWKGLANGHDIAALLAWITGGTRHGVDPKDIRKFERDTRNGLRSEELWDQAPVGKVLTAVAASGGVTVRGG